MTEFIAEFDRDGDGFLDVNEFIAAMGVMSTRLTETVIASLARTVPPPTALTPPEPEPETV